MNVVEKVDALFAAEMSGNERLAAINEFYEQEFRDRDKRKVQSLGIAYSPIEAVDYILRAVQDLLKQHWNKTLGSPGVQIIEPFAGTGTFLARLIADKSLIADDELDFKYQNEIFGNEILPLAYYAAQANIATAFEERTGKRKPFPNLWLGDTFLAHSKNANQPQPTFEIDGFKENAKILENQKQSKIRVIIGNPPWSSKKIRFSFDKSIEAAEIDFVMELIGTQKTKWMALGLAGMAIIWLSTTAQAQLLIKIYPSQDNPNQTLWLFRGERQAEYTSTIRSSGNYHRRDSWKVNNMYIANNPTNAFFNLTPLFGSTNAIDIESVRVRRWGLPGSYSSFSTNSIWFAYHATNAPTVTTGSGSKTIGSIFMNDAAQDEIGIRHTGAVICGIPTSKEPTFLEPASWTNLLGNSLLGNLEPRWRDLFWGNSRSSLQSNHPRTCGICFGLWIICFDFCYF